MIPRRRRVRHRRRRTAISRPRECKIAITALYVLQQWRTGILALTDSSDVGTASCSRSVVTRHVHEFFRPYSSRHDFHGPGRPLRRDCIQAYR